MPRIRRSDQTRRDSVAGPPPGARPAAAGWWFSTAAQECLDGPSRVTMITAPAGSGKSRLVTHWLDCHPDRNWVWIDCEFTDQPANQPIDNFTNNWTPIKDLIESESRPESTPESGLETEPGTSFPPDVLIVTGLETLTPAQQAQLVADLPAGTRVVLLSNGTGLPAGSVVRLSGELSELDAAQLWWPPAVIGEQLHRLTGVPVTESECHQLHRLTGGWPAGVIILGRALRRRPAALCAEDLSNDPEILDFVAAEVLARLPDPVQQFIRRTSVLPDLDPALCGVLVPEANPHALLAELARQGLTETSRYRPMIRGAALRALRSEQAGAEHRLLLAAGEHARQQGRDQTAADCFAAGGDAEGVIEVLAAAAPGGFRGWSPAALHRILEQLPDASWAADVERRALIAFGAAISGDGLLAAEVIHQTPAALIESAPWWSAVTLLIQALGAGHPGRSQAAYRVPAAALAELAVLDPQTEIPPILGTTDRDSLEAMAHLLAAGAGLFDGDPPRVRRHLDAGWGAERAQIPRYVVLAGLGTDALACAWAGSLTAAERRQARAQRLAEQAGLAAHPMIGLTLLAGVEVLRARGRTAAALAELEAITPALRRAESFVAAASGGRPQVAAARILRATLLLDQGDPGAAAAELDRLTLDGDDDLPVVLAAARAVAQARLQLSAGDVSAAESALRAAPATGLVAATRAAIALQRQAPDAARAAMQSWPAQDTPDSRLRLLLTTAAIALALDRRPEAGRGVDEALAVAEPEGHIQVFLDAPPAVRVLTSVVLRRSAPDSLWRQELAARLDEIRQDNDSGSVPITRRELAVLERLTTSLTHAQIAGGMFVSENTLKSHCRNLYRKLGVNSRADAVRAAQARGWLDPGARSSSSGDVVLDVNITPEPVNVEL